MPCIGFEDHQLGYARTCVKCGKHITEIWDSGEGAFDEREIHESTKNCLLCDDHRKCTCGGIVNA